MLIHQIARSRSAPNKIRAIPDESEAHGGFELLEANYHRRFPALGGLNEAIAAHFWQEIGRFIDGPAGDIAGGAI